MIEKIKSKMLITGLISIIPISLLFHYFILLQNVHICSLVIMGIVLLLMIGYTINENHRKCTDVKEDSFKDHVSVMDLCKVIWKLVKINNVLILISIILFPLYISGIYIYRVLSFSFAFPFILTLSKVENDKDEDDEDDSIKCALTMGLTILISAIVYYVILLKSPLSIIDLYWLFVSHQIIIIIRELTKDIKKVYISRKT